MARRLTTKEKDKALILSGQGVSITEIAKELDCAYNTIKSIIKKAPLISENAKLLQRSANARKKSNNELLTLLESNSMFGIADKIINILDDEELLKKEVKARGVSALNGVLKTCWDISLKYKDQSEKYKDDDNHLENEDDNFNTVVEDAIKGLANIDTKSLEAPESYVQED